MLHAPEVLVCARSNICSCFPDGPTWEMRHEESAYHTPVPSLELQGLLQCCRCIGLGRAIEACSKVNNALQLIFGQADVGAVSWESQTSYSQS